jgi:hypothetical protein
MPWGLHTGLTPCPESQPYPASTQVVSNLSSLGISLIWTHRTLRPGGQPHRTRAEAATCHRIWITTCPGPAGSSNTYRWVLPLQSRKVSRVLNQREKWGKGGRRQGAGSMQVLYKYPEWGRVPKREAGTPPTRTGPPWGFT